MTLTKRWLALPVYGLFFLPSSAYDVNRTGYRYEGNPCNRHLLGLGRDIKKSLYDADLIGYQFGAVGVSDGISMGTRGMSYSLQSRDLIADSVETAGGGHWLDGMVVVPGCDKNMPGVLMARMKSLTVTVSENNNLNFSWAAESSWNHGIRRNYTCWLV